MYDEIRSNITIVDDRILSTGLPTLATSLPKWPALVVEGKKLSQKRAAEVLIRTDGNLPDFTYAGNDKHHSRMLNAVFHLEPQEYHHGPVDNMMRVFDQAERLKKHMGVLSLEYLCNHMIVSSYVGGPHGWCDWDGTIFTNTYNIGKWPSVSEVANEWGAIAEAFPFLDLRSQLFSGETSEDDTTPVVEFRVRKGQVKVFIPTEIIERPAFSILGLSFSLGSPTHIRERGISIGDLTKKLKTVYGRVPHVEELPNE